MRRLALLLAGIALAAPASAAAQPASLTQLERQLMCVTCKIPLNVAESPQADRERALIRELIAHGEDEAQIKRTLVAEYGQQVLGLPSAHGFDLLAYLVPAAVVLGLAALLALLLPRWRARSRTGPDGAEPGAEQRPAPLAGADAARLEQDLARFD
jgi:cytochrome c-type biogenesis protein CcmH